MLPEYADKSVQTRKQKYDLIELAKKSRQTYKDKTGYATPSQNPEVKKIIQQKRKSNNKQISSRIRSTTISKYNRECSSQIHYSDSTYRLLKDKDSLQKYILDLPIEKRDVNIISELLGVHYTTMFRYLREYDLMSLVTNDGSKFEKQVREFISNLGINYKLRTRQVITPYELDIYLPDYNVAIECNGTYWHSDAVNTDKNYHYNKSKLCEEKGIRLIHIWEYEWNNERQRPILENIIKNALGLCEYKIYARKCKINVINKSSELKEFFNKNNIQGFRPGKFAVCLEYNNEIVMSYIFGHCYFGKGKYECEVIRGATKLGYNVVGGASKIWRYFINNYNYNNCVYYIDYNYFNGNSLKNLPNMEFIKTQPGFKNYFTKTGEVKNREPNRNSEIKELYLKGEVYKIYTPGTKVYVWNRESEELDKPDIKTLLDG